MNESLRRNSRGWNVDPPAYIHSRILFGPGVYLTPEFLEKHSITHVINCAFDGDSPLWFRQTYPTKYKCLEAMDSLNVSIIGWYPMFERTIHQFLREEGSKCVYIHCQAGMNRSGFLALAFACHRLNMDFQSAVAVILRQRPCALMNPAFYKQVYEFSGQT